jgi:hypothetical protein
MQIVERKNSLSASGALRILLGLDRESVGKLIKQLTSDLE